MFVPQQHITVPLRGGEDDIAIHTYDVNENDVNAFALLEVSDYDHTTNLWLFESEVRDLRDALNKVLGEGA